MIRARSIVVLTIEELRIARADTQRLRHMNRLLNYQMQRIDAHITIRQRINPRIRMSRTTNNTFPLNRITRTDSVELLYPVHAVTRQHKARDTVTTEVILRLIRIYTSFLVILTVPFIRLAILQLMRHNHQVRLNYINRPLHNRIASTYGLQRVAIDTRFRHQLAVEILLIAFANLLAQLRHRRLFGCQVQRVCLRHTVLHNRALILACRVTNYPVPLNIIAYADNRRRVNRLHTMLKQNQSRNRITSLFTLRPNNMFPKTFVLLTIPRRIAFLIRFHIHHNRIGIKHIKRQLHNRIATIHSQQRILIQIRFRQVLAAERITASVTNSLANLRHSHTLNYQVQRVRHLRALRRNNRLRIVTRRLCRYLMPRVTAALTDSYRRVQRLNNRVQRRYRQQVNTVATILTLICRTIITLLRNRLAVPHKTVAVKQLTLLAKLHRRMEHHYIHMNTVFRRLQTANRITNRRVRVYLLLATNKRQPYSVTCTTMNIIRIDNAARRKQRRRSQQQTYQYHVYSLHFQSLF